MLKSTRPPRSGGIVVKKQESTRGRLVFGAQTGAARSMFEI
jgi:hypothetical protein